MVIIFSTSKVDEGKLVFIVALVHYSLYSLEMGETQMSINKECVVYTDNGILFNLKKDGNSVMCYHMDGRHLKTLY